MNFKDCPVKNPTTHATHFGPGSQWGKPYYELGQECAKDRVPVGSARHPLSLSGTASWQCTPNQRRREVQTLRRFDDPPSARSCVVSTNKDGLVMDSQSHYVKIGSKHMCDPRPDNNHSLGRSMSLPCHPWDTRRSLLRDPTPYHFSAAFSTTSDGYGKFYSSHMLDKRTYQSVVKRHNFDWQTAKLKLK
eukprot:TRINITY_DN87173_c0_g1_i1.p1 TRINITY_DN87173_c0_g1~~TRINITY_DN87173_c0_g1_i1.p1  ORF type:complete len:190 (+),score=18.66 TRINITY_DN87173_c0_g1_i1:88-657(+)